MTVDKLLTVLDYIADWFLSIPGHWYYTAGVVIASIATAPMVVQGFKRLHIKHYSKEMTDVLVDFTITVTAALMAAADFLLTNSNNMAYFLPFLGVVLPSIKAFAPTVYNVSKAVHAFSVDRKAKKPLFASTLPHLTPLVEQVTSPVSNTYTTGTGTNSYTVSSSFGTQSAGRSTDLFKQ
jgi:hypothetical protein